MLTLAALCAKMALIPWEGYAHTPSPEGVLRDRVDWNREAKAEWGQSSLCKCTAEEHGTAQPCSFAVLLLWENFSRIFLKEVRNKRETRPV